MIMVVLCWLELWMCFVIACLVYSLFPYGDFWVSSLGGSASVSQINYCLRKKLL